LNNGSKDGSVMKNFLGDLLQMGFLRNVLHGTALFLSVMMPVSMIQIESEWWALLVLGALPALAPIIVIIIGLDIMMTSIWKADASDGKLLYYKKVIRAHLAFGGLLFLSWLAVFLPKMI
jgi:hypothetical protein